MAVSILKQLFSMELIQSTSIISPENVLNILYEALNQTGASMIIAESNTDVNLGFFLYPREYNG